MSFLEIFFSMFFWSLLIISWIKAMGWLVNEFEPETLKGKLFKILLLAFLLTIPLSFMAYIVFQATSGNTMIY